MRPLLRLVLLPLLAVTLAPACSVTPAAEASAAASVEGRVLVVAGPTAAPTTTLPEAPSSITGRDQTRGALVLGATLAVMVGFVAIATVRVRRRRARPPT